VASTADPSIVIASSSIHVLTVSRGVRAESLAGFPAHSGDEDTEVETLCQNSGVAIFVPQTSNIQDIRGESPALQREIRRCTEKIEQSPYPDFLFDSNF
jgi:hypothetical protein